MGNGWENESLIVTTLSVFLMKLVEATKWRDAVPGRCNPSDKCEPDSRTYYANHEVVMECLPTLCMLTTLKYRGIPAAPRSLFP